MKKINLIMVSLLIFSCEVGQDSLLEDSQSATQDILAEESKNNSNARTTCEICMDKPIFVSYPTIRNYNGSYSGVGSHYYPPITVPISPNTLSIGVLVRSEAIPNKFKITYVTKPGTPTVALWDSNWMGVLDFPGPWLNPWGPTVIKPSIKTAPVVNTTAQSTQWPCPWALPETSNILEYKNTTGTPSNGVTWNVLANSPTGSAALVNGGQILQPINFTSTFASTTTTQSFIEVQAVPNSPFVNPFDGCNTRGTIYSPLTSNVTAIILEVWTSNPGPSYPSTPNQDAWSATVTVTLNNNTECSPGPKVCF